MPGIKQVTEQNKVKYIVNLPTYPAENCYLAESQSKSFKPGLNCPLTSLLYMLYIFYVLENLTFN